MPCSPEPNLDVVAEVAVMGQLMKSTARIAWACGQELSPARPRSSWGGIENRGFRIVHTVDAAIGMSEADQFALNPSNRPQPGFSRAIRRTRARIGVAVGGRPGRRCG